MFISKIALLGRFIVAFILLSFVHAGAESGKYVIQLGTFAPEDAAVRYAETLEKTPAFSGRTTLRVERGAHYHTVRMGLFEKLTPARTVLEAVRKTVPDAFVLNEQPETAERIVWVYGGYTTADRNLAVVGRNDDKPLNSLSGAWKALANTLPQNPSARIVLFKQPAHDGTAGAATPSPGEKTVTVEIRGDGDNAGGSSAPDIPSPGISIASAAELVSEGRYDDALSVVRAALRRWPDDPELHAWYGSTLLALDQPEDALVYYRKAAELSPDSPEYPTAAGYSLMHMYRKNVEESLKSFENALALDPENSAALEGLAAVYVSVGDVERAQAVAEQLADIDPGAYKRVSELIEYGIDWRRD